jgi:hypothetical protein
LISTDDYWNFTRKYRVANIFHVKGFQYLSAGESYDNLDGGSGEILQKFLGSFLITPDYYYFNQIGCSQGAVFRPRQFAIKEIGTTFSTVFDKGDLQSAFFYLKDGQPTLFENSALFATLFYKNANLFSGLSGLFLVLFIVSLAVLALSVVRAKKACVNSFYLFGLEILPGFVFLLVAETLLAVFPALSLPSYAFFNIFGNIFFLLWMALWLFLVWGSKKE